MARLHLRVQCEVADRLDDSGENKTKRENQRGAIVRAAKTHQRVRRVAEADQRAANFQIEIALRAAGNSGISQVGDQPEVTDRNDGIRENRQARDTRRSTVFDTRRPDRASVAVVAGMPQKPDDLGPTAHEIPPNAEESR